MDPYVRPSGSLQCHAVTNNFQSCLYGHDYELDRDLIDQLRRELASIPCVALRQRTLASYSMRDCDVPHPEIRTISGRVCVDKHCVYGHKKGSEM